MSYPTHHNIFLLCIASAKKCEDAAKHVLAQCVSVRSCKLQKDVPPPDVRLRERKICSLVNSFAVSDADTPLSSLTYGALVYSHKL